MKRDDWKLGSGIRAGDDAYYLKEDGTKEICHVVKVTGGSIRGYPKDKGNVLIEINGEYQVVYGKSLRKYEDQFE